MKQIINNKLIIGLLGSLFFSLFVLPAQAEEGAIRFSNNAFKQEITTDKNGKKHFDFVEPKLVLPGDVILYEIEFENVSDQTISDIVVNTPLPNNSKFRAGSAKGKFTQITFSVDGNNYKTAESLIVKDKTGKSWLAKPEDYQAIRWVYKRALKPGEKSKVSYKTEIKNTNKP